MMHVDEEQLQRLVDEELASPADESVREHVVHCESCRDRVARARIEQEEVFALLGSLDHPRERADHAAVIARGRARNSKWMGKAAGFLLAAAVAGAAYAAPGSPLPSLVAGIFGSGSDAPGAPVVQRGAPETPMVSGVTVATGNRMVIAFTATQAAGELRVTLSDDAEIEVRATGAGASFTSGDDALTIDNANSRADFAVAIPRNARMVEIRIGERRVFLKNGARIVTDYGVTYPDTYLIPLGQRR